MAAVVRLKRPLNEEPLNALIINCKKRKTDTANSENEEKEISSVLKFIGTVHNQEEDFSQHILKPTKTQLEEQYKKHIPDVTSKIRQQNKELSKNNRLKIVNLYRDVECQKTVVDVEIDNEKKSDLINIDYVYDLYYTNSDGFCESELNNVLSVCTMDELVFDNYRDENGICDESSSDDSNDENNWRNDYPDEEDAESIGESDMRNAVKRLTMDDDLSSDSGSQEGFIYSIDSEEMGLEEDLDYSDVRRYGEMYARFKARQKKEEERYNKDIYHDDIDTDPDEYSE